MKKRSKRGKSTNKGNTERKSRPWYWRHQQSIGEGRIERFLRSHNIFFLPEARFSDNINPKTGLILSFDFYIPDLKVAIEYQGEQHTQYVKRFHGSKKKDNLKKQQDKDALKREYCKNHKYKLIEIFHTDWKDLEKILERELILKSS